MRFRRIKNPATFEAIYTLPIQGGILWRKFMSFFAEVSLPFPCHVHWIQVQPSFCFSVSHVIGLTPPEQVNRPETRRIVTTMERANRTWSFYGQPMSKDHSFSIKQSSVSALFTSGPLKTWVISPWLGLVITFDRFQHLMKKFDVANLVSHREALLGSWCAALSDVRALRGLFYFTPLGVQR